MVIRQQKEITDSSERDQMRTPAVAVDLDGTLVEVNTFRQLIYYLIKKLFAKGKYRELSKIAMLLITRKMNLITHVTLKYPIHQIASENLSKDEVTEFVEILKTYINKELISRVKVYHDEGYKMIIATAAPEFYVKELCRAIGFDAYISTALTPTKKEYREVRGDKKVSELKRLAGEHNLDVKVVASDHEDDLPLLTQPDIVRLLVKPTAQLKMQMRSTGLAFELIP